MRLFGRAKQAYASRLGAKALPHGKIAAFWQSQTSLR